MVSPLLHPNRSGGSSAYGSPVDRYYIEIGFQGVKSGTIIRVVHTFASTFKSLIM
jgi:hypothetical protein